MKRILISLTVLFLCTTTYAQENIKTIKGKITYLDGPTANADIKVSGSDVIWKSDADGAYEIQAYQGDIITFSYPSLRDVEVVVEDVTRILNITMSPDVTALDEVVVEASKRRSQRDMQEDYDINKNIIRTAFGYLDADRAAGQIRLMNEDEINPVTLCILDLVRGQFPGILVDGDCNRGGELYLSRGIRQGPMVWDIDGQIFTGSGPNGPPSAPVWVDVNSIKRIAILQNLATTATYGSAGDGGVVVINTVNGVLGSKSGKVLDRARLRNNIYKGGALSKNEISKNAPTYLLDYEASATAEQAKIVYENNYKKYYNSPHFFIDSYAFFMNEGEEKFATDILDKNVPLVDKNAVYLKALAYYAEASRDIKTSTDVYEQVFILRPNYAQSYRDLAEAYRNNKNYKKAAAMYARYNYLVDEGFLQADSVGLGPIIERDAENLLALEGDQVFEGGKTKKRLAKYTEFDGTRLLFEWNDSEAEFELQFVNPEKHYHTWKHTSMANSSRIMDEKLKGYSAEEFLIDGSLAGKWQVNINYLGNKKLEPTYLKVTTYFNYGLKSQRKETKVFRLGLRNKQHELFSLSVGGKL
ncbi:DUF2135 domain-containing protein [Maribacter sp. 2307UL18-2]|uniref:DUF2135 domain-containing protein n=1 Tax=Maribacter sp. 2307UL18-2 TaxID=3386274 RepID=UPI0039BD3232